MRRVGIDPRVTSPTPDCPTPVHELAARRRAIPVDLRHNVCTALKVVLRGPTCGAPREKPTTSSSHLTLPPEL